MAVVPVMAGRWEAARAQEKAKAPPAKKLDGNAARAHLED
jgi:hypothetical protein